MVLQLVRLSSFLLQEERRGEEKGQGRAGFVFLPCCLWMPDPPAQPCVCQRARQPECASQRPGVPETQNLASPGCL